MKFSATGWLERDRPDDPPVILMTTERTCRLDRGEPRGLVNHFTAVETTLKNMIAMCKRTEKMAPPLTAAQIAAGEKRRNPSWNFLLCMGGTIIQCAPITRGTFAVVGVGNVLGAIGTVNALTIQLEIENAGRLRQLGKRFYQSPHYIKGTRQLDPRQEIPAARVFGSHEIGWWTMYTGEQQLSAAYLYAALIVRFGWRGRQLSLTHEQFNSPRKTDPGAAWTKMVQPVALAHAEMLANLWRSEPAAVPA